MQGSRAPRKRLVRALLVLVLLVTAALAGGIFYLKSRISPERISLEASALLRRKFGFALSVGELRLTWSGNAELRRICVRNEAMQSPRCLFSADIVQLDLRLLPLLRRQLEIRGALLENCELNLFTELAQSADGKKVTHGSWQGQMPAAVPDNAQAATASPMFLKLDNLTIRNAVIAHEAQVLPIPLGKTELSLDLRSAGERLALRAQLPDGSRLTAELQLKMANFLETARLVVAGPRLADSDSVKGVVECERCNLSGLDHRAGILTGRMQLNASATELRVDGEGVQVTTHNAYAPTLTWSGHAVLALPALYPAAGEGKLSGQGFNVQYRRLAGSPKTGIEAEFSAEADLAQLPAASGVKGAAFVQGRLQNRALSASFSLRGFATAAPGFPVSAERLDGSLLGSRIRLSKQAVTMAGNTAEVSLSADTAVTPIPLEGTMAFAQLNLDAFAGRDRPAATQASQTRGQKIPAISRVKANVQLSAGALLLGKLKTGPLRAQLYTDGLTTEAKSLQVELGKGRIQGSYLKQADGAQNFSFRAAGVKAQDLNALMGFKATIYGTIDADGWLGFTGSSVDSVLKTGTGQFSLRLGRGKIRDSFLQKGVLSGPLHKLEEKFSDIEFASAQAEVRLNPNKIQVQKFYFDAEEWNVTYRAEADADWQGKSALTLRFRSSFVENVANPLHLGISDRKDGDFYDLPFACRGAVLSGDCYKKNW